MHFPKKLCSCPRLPWLQLQTSGVKQKDANLSTKTSQQLSYLKSNERQIHFQIPKSRLAEARALSGRLSPSCLLPELYRESNFCLLSLQSVQVKYGSY